MEMYNPPSPGEVILEIFLRPQGISIRKCAAMLDLPTSDFLGILKGQEGINENIAARLSAHLGFTTTGWLNMQASYDRWLARLAAQDCPS